MDSIKKKIQGLKSETDILYSQIWKFEEETKHAKKKADKCESDIREVAKKIGLLEAEYDTTNDKLGMYLLLKHRTFTPKQSVIQNDFSLLLLNKI